MNAQIQKKIEQVANAIRGINVDTVQNYDESKKSLIASDIFFEEDRDMLSEFLKKNRSKNYMLQLQFPPEPWIGNIKNPSVIILSGNPGFDFDEKKGNLARLKNLEAKHQLQDFLEITAGQIEGKDNCNFLIHQVCEGDDDPIIIGETDYWKNKLLEFVKTSVHDEGNDSLKSIVSRIAIFEVHPYHSKSYEDISNGKLLPSQNYILHVIRDILQKQTGKVSVILFRAHKYWMKHLNNKLKELSKNNMLFALASTQNNKVTANNIISFDEKRWRLLDELAKYSEKDSKMKAYEKLHSILDNNIK